ncbi:MAG: hypothetical protein M3P84_02505, partial [Chloroflexota bacterium]|nr:hypothetical protein [Chloroflexota bacterium]
PPGTMTVWRDGEASSIAVPSVDQVAAEVDDLTAAILDGSSPRIDLGFSRGTISTLVNLDRAARSNGGPRAD